MQSVTMHSKVSSRLYNNHRIQQRNAVKRLVGGGDDKWGNLQLQQTSAPGTQSNRCSREGTNSPNSSATSASFQLVERHLLYKILSLKEEKYQES